MDRRRRPPGRCALAPRLCGLGRCSRAALRPGRYSGRASRCSATLGPPALLFRCARPPAAAGLAPSGPRGFAASPRGDAAAMRAPRSAGLSEQRAVRGPFRGPRGFGASSRLRGRGAGPQARCGSQVPRLHPGYEGAGTTAQSRRKNIIPNRKPAATAREIAVKGCRSIEVLSASPREEDASRT